MLTGIDCREAGGGIQEAPASSHDRRYPFPGRGAGARMEGRCGRTV